MPSKRTLKKSIKSACGNVAGECIFAQMRLENLDQDKVENIVCQVALMQIGFIDRVSTKFDKKVSDFADAKACRKARTQYFKNYYSSLWQDLTDNIEKVVEEMNAMLTPEQKEANKQEAN